jgi:hypothetical protein
MPPQPLLSAEYITNFEQSEVQVSAGHECRQRSAINFQPPAFSLQPLLRARLCSMAILGQSRAGRPRQSRQDASGPARGMAILVMTKHGCDFRARNR